VQKKCETPDKPGFRCFAGVFEGCFGKSDALAWSLYGGFVVKSVVNVDS
jgi:hypothetical protein